MANESLRDVLESIEADETEMQRYRSRLAPKLCRRPRFYWLAPIGVAAAAAMAFWIFLAWPRQINFSPLSLDQVHTMARRSSPEILEKARTLVREGKGEARWNANMLLCLVDPKDRAVEYAGRGLEEDPRPEFRASYLEFLLDQADERQYDTADIERNLDREEDSICIALYQELLRIARMQEQYWGPVAENGILIHNYPFAEANTCNPNPLAAGAARLDVRSRLSGRFEAVAAALTSIAL